MKEIELSIIEGLNITFATVRIDEIYHGIMLESSVPLISL